jgi:putative transposase
MKTIKKSYNLRYYPTQIQRDHLEHEFGCGRFVFNHFLAKHTQAKWLEYQYLISSGCLPDELALLPRFNSFNFNQASFELTQLKKDKNFSWLKDVNSSNLTQKLVDLNAAFQNYFDAIKKNKSLVKGKKKSKEQLSGFPQFKRKSHEQSIRLQLDQRHVHKNFIAGQKLNLPLLGEVKLIWSIIPKGVPAQVTIRKKANGHYYISFMCEEVVLPFAKTGKTTGLDFGIKESVVTSDNNSFGPNQYLKSVLRSLAREQRYLSKKTKGSNRWKKQRLVVARIHAKVVNARKDLIHKISSYLIQHYDVICIEDLALKNMVKNHKLARAISDVAIGELVRQLKYKADWYGKTIVQVGRFYPSSKTCSHCGAVKPHLALKERTFKCEECGVSLDRDWNSAMNIEKEGCRLLEKQLLEELVTGKKETPASKKRVFRSSRSG